LLFASKEQLKGRTFNCEQCVKATKKIRRCLEDREDFTSDDGSNFPIRILEGGELYGFCPGKATRDLQVYEQFKQLIICAETGTMLFDGGLLNQPEWFIESLSWFLRKYDMLKFTSKAEMILGKDNGSNRRPISKN